VSNGHPDARVQPDRRKGTDRYRRTDTQMYGQIGHMVTHNRNIWSETYGHTQ